MPRARCHWALLLQTRDALHAVRPEAHALVCEHQNEFLAGGVTPDALRLFAGRDKLSSHFYDDQRPETWECVAQAMRDAHPGVADPERLAPPTRAWLLGYLAHVMTDIAYWRHVISRLPPFPQERSLHAGAWILADQVLRPAHERQLAIDRIRFDAAPPWVDELAVRQMLERVIGRILVPDDIWAAEAAYHHGQIEAAGQSEASIVAERRPQWEACVAAAHRLLPPDVWRVFYRDAVRLSTETIGAYLPH